MKNYYANYIKTYTFETKLLIHTGSGSRQNKLAPTEVTYKGTIKFLQCNNFFGSSIGSLKYTG
jgi:hypothetical protein